jgi:hypothetical protein
MGGGADSMAFRLYFNGEFNEAFNFIIWCTTAEGGFYIYLGF